MKKFIKWFVRDDGNIESVLVLIPLLILFLTGTQIIAATNLRNSDMAIAQGDAAARSISHQFQRSDQIIEVGGSFEKIRFLITHRSQTLPQLVPGLLAIMDGNPATDVVGISVIEPSN